MLQPKKDQSLGRINSKLQKTTLVTSNDWYNSSIVKPNDESCNVDADEHFKDDINLSYFPKIGNSDQNIENMLDL